MPPPSLPPKALRIAVLQGGRILEERLFRRRERVLVGPGARNTLVLPASPLPASQPLFEPDEGRYHLVFTADMQGRVLVGGRELELAALRAEGLARPRGELFAFPLDETARGRLALGDVTLLFQFVQPPAPPDRAELPREVRGHLLAGADRLFLAVLALSVAVHLTCGAGMLLAEPPQERELALDELPDRFATLLLPPKTPEAHAPKAEAPPTPKAEETPEAATPPSEEAPPPGAPSAERAAEARRRVATLGLLGAMKATGGSAADVLGAGHTLATDFASALQGVSGVKAVSTTEPLAAAAPPKGGGTGRVAGIGDLAPRAPAKVDLASKTDVEVRGHVAESAPAVDGAEVDRAALAQYVRLRLRAIQACYERELKRNPSLQGKVLVRFAIGASGRTTQVDIEENTLGNEAVAQCVRALIRTWAFPFQPAEEVTVSYPFVFAPAS